MNKTFTQPFYVVIAYIIFVVFILGLTVSAFLSGLETANIIALFAVVFTIVLGYKFFIVPPKIEISVNEVIFLKGKTEKARYNRNDYNFELIKRRYPGQKSPSIIFIAKSGDQKIEHEISNLGKTAWNGIANELGIKAPEMLIDVLKK